MREHRQIRTPQLMRSTPEYQLHVHARVSHQTYQLSQNCRGLDIFRKLGKKALRARVELEEFVDLAFALLQWPVWISSQTRLVSHRGKKCDADFVEMFVYVPHKCEGVATIIRVFGAEVIESRKN